MHYRIWNLNQWSQAANDGNCIVCADLISALNQVWEMILESKEEDLLYDINVAVEHVEVNMNRKIWGAQ